MACLLDSCEKEIQQRLVSYRKSVGALLQLQKAIQQVQILPPPENPEELLKSVVNQVICKLDNGNIKVSNDRTSGEQIRTVADVIDLTEDDGICESDDQECSKHESPSVDDGEVVVLPDQPEGIERVDDETTVVITDYRLSCQEYETELLLADQAEAHEADEVDTADEADEADEAHPADEADEADEAPGEADEADEAPGDADEADEAPVEATNDNEIEDGDSPKLFSTVDKSLKNEDISLLFLGGPKVGVKYEIEVTSPLHPDGTFWAAHVECGDIQDKLERLSELLRASTKADRSLWKVDKLDDMICLKSSENGLWMRAVVVKEINDGAVKLLFIDVGRSEECQRSRLSKVPKSLADIPYMAFYCSLFEEEVKIPYEGRWRFNDICKTKILNFTSEKFIMNGNKKLLVGKVETILDDPPINIAEDIKSYMKPDGLSSAQQESDSIVSRDIRTKGGNITSVTEIIRSENAMGSNSSLSSNISNSEQTNQKKVHLPPVLIPSRDESCYSSNDKLSWGDSKTPTAADLEEIFNETVHFTPEDPESYDQEMSKFNFEDKTSKTVDDATVISQEDTCQDVYNSAPESTEVDVAMVRDNVDLVESQQNQYIDSSVAINSNIPITQMDAVNSNIPINQMNATNSNIPITQMNAINSNIPINQMNAISSNIPINQMNATNSNIPITQMNAFNSNIPINQMNATNSNIPITQMNAINSNIPITQMNEINSNIPITQMNAINSNIPITEMNAINSNIPITQMNAINSNIPITQMNAIAEMDQQSYASQEYRLKQLQMEYLRLLNIQQNTASTVSLVQNMPCTQIPQQVMSPCFERTHPGQPQFQPMLQHPIPVQSATDQFRPGINGARYPNNVNNTGEIHPGQREGYPNMCRYPVENHDVSQYPSYSNPQPIPLRADFPSESTPHLPGQPLYNNPHLDRNIHNTVTPCDGMEKLENHPVDVDLPCQYGGNSILQNKGPLDLPSSVRGHLLNPPVTEENKYASPKYANNEFTNNSQYKKMSSSPVETIEATYPKGPRFMNKNNTRKKSGDYERDTPKSNSQNSYSVAKQHCINSVPTRGASNKSPVPREKFNNNYSNRCQTGEERYSSKSASGEELKKFEEVTFDRMQTESRNDWIAREIYNLTHPYFEHKKARFFTVMIRENSSRWFGTILLNALQKKTYYMRECADVDIFRKAWAHNEGPLFLFVKHWPFNPSEKWKTGGIFQVITKIRQLPEHKYHGSVGCQVKFVSTALMDPEYNSLRSDKTTREVQPDVARAYIRHLITKLQDGCCENLFLLPQYSLHKQRDINSNSNQTNDQEMEQMMASQPKEPILPGEDWDLALEEIKVFSTNEFGSDDESEQRDLNLEIEVYGLNQDDM